MAAGLQEVDPTLLASLHEAAMRLGSEARKRFAGEWRPADPAARAVATVAGLTVSTQLMEAMSWLLSAQAVAAGERRDPGPATWHAGPADPAGIASIGELAETTDRLYRRIIQADAEVR